MHFQKTAAADAAAPPANVLVYICAVFWKEAVLNSSQGI